MKAMVLTAAADVKLADVDVPSLTPNQVLVRVTHSGICGTDLKIYKGAIPVRYPRIMGHEMIGTVVDGDDDRIRRGDRVIVDPAVFCGACFHCRVGRSNLCPNGVLLGRDADGGFAEYLAVPRSQVFHLPDAIDEQAAPLIQVLTTCLRAQRFVDIFPAQSVVVMGLGVAGQLHVQLAKARGASPVIGVTRSAWKRRLAEELGADMTLSSGPDAVRGIAEVTDGRGADVIIESTGTMSVVAASVSMVRLGGTLLLYGIMTATEGALPFYQLYYKELAIVNSRAAKGEDFPPSIDLVARGVVQLKPLISHVVPLAELGKAIGMLESDADQRMKIILESH